MGKTSNETLFEIYQRHKKSFKGDNEHLDLYAHVKKNYLHKRFRWFSFKHTLNPDNPYKVKLSKDGENAFNAGKAVFVLNQYNNKIYVLQKNQNQTYHSKSFESLGVKGAKHNKLTRTVFNVSQSLLETFKQFKSFLASRIFEWNPSTKKLAQTDASARREHINNSTYLDEAEKHITLSLSTLYEFNYTNSKFISIINNGTSLSPNYTHQLMDIHREICELRKEFGNKMKEYQTYLISFNKTLKEYMEFKKKEIGAEDFNDDSDDIRINIVNQCNNLSDSFVKLTDEQLRHFETIEKACENFQNNLINKKTNNLKDDMDKLHDSFNCLKNRNDQLSQLLDMYVQSLETLKTSLKTSKDENLSSNSSEWVRRPGYQVKVPKDKKLKTSKDENLSSNSSGWVRRVGYQVKVPTGQKLKTSENDNDNIITLTLVSRR